MKIDIASATGLSRKLLFIIWSVHGRRLSFDAYREMMSLDLPGLTDYVWDQLVGSMILEYGNQITVDDNLSPLIAKN